MTEFLRYFKTKFVDVPTVWELRATIGAHCGDLVVRRRIEYFGAGDLRRADYGRVIFDVAEPRICEASDRT